jgi:hypothetical protein
MFHFQFVNQKKEVFAYLKVLMFLLLENLMWLKLKTPMDVAHFAVWA